MLAVADHHDAGRVRAAFPQPAQAHFRFAFGIDVRQAQQRVETGTQAEMLHLLLQILPFGGGEHHLAHALRTQRVQHGAGIRLQWTAKAAGRVQPHVFIRKCGERMTGKIEPRPAVIGLDGKAEDLPVGFHAAHGRITVAGKHRVQKLAAQRGVIQQRAVPIPQDRVENRHGLTPWSVKMRNSRGPSVRPYGPTG